MRRVIAFLFACSAVGTVLADSFGYDDSGRVLTVEQSNGLNHSYSYDGEANLLSGSSGGTTGGNGVADWWENFYFSTTGINPLASEAGDGVSNITKYALGRNPLSAISTPLVNLIEDSVSGQSYKYFTYSRSIANASMTYLEQSSDQVNWFGGGGYFVKVGPSIDFGNGIEQVTYRNLTPLPAANALSFRLVTNGGSPSLTAYNTIESGTGVPSMPWWAFVITLFVLTLVAQRFLRSGRLAACVLFASSLLLSGDPARAELGPGWYGGESVITPPTPGEPGSETTSSQFAHSQEGDIQPLSLISGPEAAAVTPELQAVATGLNNDPLAIFNYVCNKITFQPYYGSCKGAHTTYLDAAGNDMDQASLLIALLNAAGHNNTSYVYGKITMRESAVDGKDLSHWLVTTPATTSWVLANAGFPNLVGTNFGSYTTWTFDHVWVRAVIGGTTYDLDPSLKFSELFTGIDCKTASGYSRAQLVSDAAGTTGTDFVQNVNRVAVENRLGTYATALRATLRRIFPMPRPRKLSGAAKLPNNLCRTFPPLPPCWPDFLRLLQRHLPTFPRNIARRSS